MKKDKLMYNPPVVEPLVIRFEGWVCASQQVAGGGSFSSPTATVDDHSDEDDWGW